MLSFLLAMLIANLLKKKALFQIEGKACSEVSDDKSH